jgi:hypothetical protein
MEARLRAPLPGGGRRAQPVPSRGRRAGGGGRESTPASRRAAKQQAAAKKQRATQPRAQQIEKEGLLGHKRALKPQIAGNAHATSNNHNQEALASAAERVCFSSGAVEPKTQGGNPVGSRGFGASRAFEKPWPQGAPRA